jgi:hypothetical protein
VLNYLALESAPNVNAPDTDQSSHHIAAAVKPTK